MTPVWVIPLTPLNLFGIGIVFLYIIGSWALLITVYYRLKRIPLLEEYIRYLETSRRNV